MDVVVAAADPLRFTDGSPVRAASAVVGYDGGWLVAQDDATHGCLLPSIPGPGTRLRLLPPVGGLDAFDEAAGTKHLKPDLEAACALGVGALLLGSGSTPARMRGVLLHAPGSSPVVADLAPLYARLATALDIVPEQLNLEGACPVGGALRWFHRGRPSGGLPAAFVDVPLDALVAAVEGTVPPDAVPLAEPVVVHLGDGLAVTDAVALGDGRVLVSAALEDAPSAYDDGPVLASALALLLGDRVVARVLLPEVGGRIAKVEGLAVRPGGAGPLRLVATVDADDPGLPSLALDLRVTL